MAIRISDARLRAMIPDLGTEDRTYTAGTGSPGPTPQMLQAMQDRYAAFAAEARAMGMTDEAAINAYAQAKNREWGDANGINGDLTWLDEHPWMAPVMVLGAGLGA